MRLFVGLVPPPAALDDLDAACAPFRLARDDLRWTSRELWHLTLAFLGEVSEERLARLAAPAGAGRQAAPGVHPAAWRARARSPSRCGPTCCGAACPATAARWPISRRRCPPPPAGPASPPPDADRGFTPHLTLARCRAPVDVREIVDRLDGYQGPGWTVEEIYLIRSTLDGRPRYETLETWKLASGRLTTG